MRKSADCESFSVVQSHLLQLPITKNMRKMRLVGTRAAPTRDFSQPLAELNHFCQYRILMTKLRRKSENMDPRY